MKIHEEENKFPIKLLKERLIELTHSDKADTHVGDRYTKHMFSYDPVITGSNVFMHTMISMAIDIPDKNNYPIIYQYLPKYRKLAKRRNRYSKVVKRFKDYYKKIKLI